MTEFPISGGCLCGAVRFRVTAEPLDAYYCHCRMCQRATGAPVLAGATVPIEGFAFTKGEPAVYQSSANLVRLFCGTCGGQLALRHAVDPKLVDFNLGCLDDPEAIKPNGHVFTSSRIGWFEVADSLPRHAEQPPDLESLWGPTPT